MSGKGPRTFAGLGDLPGNAGSMNVTGSPWVIAETIFEWCGAWQLWQGEVRQVVRGSEIRRNCITSAKMSLAIAAARENDDE